MSERKEIHRALAAVAPRRGDWLVIHSSLAGLRLSLETLKWDLLWALSLLARQGRTIALPTFTFDFCRNGRYHHRASPGEAGQLGQWALDLAEARRTPHPIYSFAVLGPGAEELCAAKNSTTFGDDSTFALFEARDARLVMLGCEWQSCTQVHRYEELRQVPYRFYKEFRGTADFGAGEHEAMATMFVRQLRAEAENDFTRLFERLRSADRIRSIPLGAGRVESIGCRELAEACSDLLAGDELALVREPEVVKRRLQKLSRGGEPLRIALLGQANLELIRSAVLEGGDEFSPLRPVKVYCPPFGRLYQEILSSDSLLRRFTADASIFVNRLEDVFQVESLDELAERDDLDAIFDQYVAAIRTYASAASGRVFVQNFAAVRPTAAGAFDASDPEGIAAQVAHYNAQLREALADRPEIFVFDLAQAALAAGAGAVYDPRLWHLGRFAYSAPFSRFLARRYWGLVLAATGQTVRLIALDLDGTLWGGVLGEDGLAGLKLGGDYPGSAYRSFQKCLRRLARRGVALALCSKNDEPHALAAIRELPEMALAEGDFAARRIDWRPKWQNLAEIAAELALGLEHVLFVDDNPAERELVRRRLPAVKVLELPEDPALFVSTLLESPYLECLSPTAEDRRRAESYRARGELQGRREAFERPEDFYAWLESRLKLAPLHPGNACRAEQLVQKTNQFNATSRRYSRRELEQLQAAGAGVYVIGLADRFSPHENVGVLVVRWDAGENAAAEIDTLLLSCRVLGRGLETGVLAWLCREAARRSVREIVGLITPTERNAPIRSLYRDHGFEPAGAEGRWRLDLGCSAVPLPPWLEIIEARETSQGAGA
ncbi:MAG TPA: HAD-IIIC family phosphatase [Pirellulales bacterium]|nr:HAD-IIIC family phosphatase [Pirellulales bacterium]